eukprot:1142476-Rhodomonas_salina.2
MQVRCERYTLAAFACGHPPEKKKTRGQDRVTGLVERRSDMSRTLVKECDISTRLVKEREEEEEDGKKGA